MDVVVTGSSGLVGSAVVPALADAGHRPVPMVRRPAGGDELGWDPEAGTIDEAGLEGVGAVVHLAGAPIADRRWTEERKQLILESRTRGTRLLVGALTRATHPPRVLLSASGIHYYGDRGDTLLTESLPRGSGFLADVAAAWEAATAPAEQAGIRVAHLRTSMVLSRRGGALAKMLPLFRLGLGGRIGSGRQYWSWISLSDQVRAMLWLLDHDLSGPVNLTGPEPVTNGEFTRALGTALSRPTLVPVPPLGPKLLLGSELAQELLLSSIRARPERLLGSGFRFQHPNLAAALRAELARELETAHEPRAGRR